jgi:hypothetical protein
MIAEAVQTPAAAAVAHPNFFLVGAARSGTTSLWHYLRDHPEIHMPSGLVGKEPTFFCDLTPPWATKYRTYEQYLTLFTRAGRRKAVGDASTNYLVAPESAARIHERYPEARIVVILRNPVQRAYSLYRFLCGWGLESAATFEKALAREHERFGNERFKQRMQVLYYAFHYVNSGLYSAQLERYFKTFSRERVFVVLYDDLKRDAVETSREVYRFLGVDAEFEPEIAIHNASGFPLSIAAQGAIARRWHTHPLVPRGEVRRRDRLHFPVAFGINTLLGRYRSARMRPETRRALTKQFRDDVEKTAVLIGRNLDSWLEERPARADVSRGPIVASPNEAE